MGDKFLRSLQVNTKVELKKDRKVCESCVDENGKERGYAEPIQLIIATQDVVSLIEEKSSCDGCLQEEVDELWDMVKKLL